MCFLKLNELNRETNQEKLFKELIGTINAAKTAAKPVLGVLFK